MDALLNQIMTVYFAILIIHNLPIQQVYVHKKHNRIIKVAKLVLQLAI